MCASYLQLGPKDQFGMRSSGYGSVAAAMETAALENAEAMLLRLETDPTARGERGVSILHGVVAGDDTSNLGFETTNPLVLEQDEAKDQERAESSDGDGVAGDDASRTGSTAVSTTTTTTTTTDSKGALNTYSLGVPDLVLTPFGSYHDGINSDGTFINSSGVNTGVPSLFGAALEHGLGGVGASAGSSRYSGGGVGAAAAARTDDRGVKVTSTGGSDTRWVSQAVGRVGVEREGKGYL